MILFIIGMEFLMLYGVYYMLKCKYESYIIENKALKLKIENLKTLNNSIEHRLEISELESDIFNKRNIKNMKYIEQLEKLNENKNVTKNEALFDENVKLKNQISILEFEIKTLKEMI